MGGKYFIEATNNPYDWGYWENYRDYTDDIDEAKAIIQKLNSEYKFVRLTINNRENKNENM